MENVTKEWGFDPQKAKEKIVKDIRDWFDNHLPYGNAVLGISSGKDSTITAALLCEAIGKERVIGVLMPNGVQKDISDSYRVCKLLGIKSLEINIEGAYNSIVNSLKEYCAVTTQTTFNLPPRLRMTTLFAVAQSNNAVVINTGNESEYTLGWFTFGSDLCGSYAPILDYTCTEVIEIGRALGLPEDLICKTPSDGLCGKSDEEKFGFSYADCDLFLRTGKYSSQEIHDKIIGMCRNSHFKRIPIAYSRNKNKVPHLI